MQLRDLIQPRDFLVPFDPRDKWTAIEQLLDHVCKHASASGEMPEQWRSQVLGRERSMSTGMERGIAIPHAAVDGLDEVRAAVGLIQREGGLPFDSIDGKAASVVVLLLIPRAQKLAHIRTLADIARVLGKESVRNALLASGDGTEAWNAIDAEALST